MARVWQELTRSIECVDDDGGRHLVDEYQEVRETSDLSGTHVLRGLKDMRLRGGGPVNFIDENTFRIVRTGQTIRRIER